MVSGEDFSKCTNINRVECRVLPSIAMARRSYSTNINIVECRGKTPCSTDFKQSSTNINRVECRDQFIPCA